MPYEVVRKKEEKVLLRRRLKKDFSNNSIIYTVKLSSPGGPINNAKVYYRPDLDVWAYFGAKMKGGYFF